MNASREFARYRFRKISAQRAFHLRVKPVSVWQSRIRSITWSSLTSQREPSLIDWRAWAISRRLKNEVSPPSSIHSEMGTARVWKSSFILFVRGPVLAGIFGFESHSPFVAKKTDSTRYAVPALRFKTCRLLSGNVRNRELTIIQRRILRRLRNKKRKIYPRENLNSYIQSQTTRKLPLFHGDLPITEMHRGTERTSYIPFPLNPETRSDVIPVRLHFCETIPQARQPISHRRVCVNNGMVSITHLKVSHGDPYYRFRK